MRETTGDHFGGVGNNGHLSVLRPDRVGPANPSNARAYWLIFLIGLLAACVWTAVIMWPSPDGHGRQVERRVNERIEQAINAMRKQ